MFLFCLENGEEGGGRGRKGAGRGGWEKRVSFGGLCHRPYIQKIKSKIQILHVGGCQSL